MWVNLWLSVFPIMFVGLFVGLRFHKTGGYLVAVPIAFSLILGFFINGSIVTIMFLPLAIGIMNIILGYMDEDNINTGS
jgi:general stress protein CsbA